MPVIQALEEPVEKYPAIGFWQSHYRLRKKTICETTKKSTASILPWD